MFAFLKSLFKKRFPEFKVLGLSNDQNQMFTSHGTLTFKAVDPDNLDVTQPCVGCYFDNQPLGCNSGMDVRSNACLRLSRKDGKTGIWVK